MKKKPALIEVEEMFLKDKRGGACTYYVFIWEVFRGKKGREWRRRSLKVIRGKTVAECNRQLEALMRRRDVVLITKEQERVRLRFALVLAPAGATSATAGPMEYKVMSPLTESLEREAHLEKK